LGIFNEDYDYTQTNRLLKIPTKTFIKHIACSPNKITKKDVLNLRKTFSTEEIFHLIILVSMIKCRSELIFISYIIYDIIKEID
jgi:hypothetical protein